MYLVDPWSLTFQCFQWFGFAFLLLARESSSFGLALRSLVRRFCVTSLKNQECVASSCFHDSDVDLCCSLAACCVIAFLRNDYAQVLIKVSSFRLQPLVLIHSSFTAALGVRTAGDFRALTVLDGDCFQGGSLSEGQRLRILAALSGWR